MCGMQSSTQHNAALRIDGVALFWAMRLHSETIYRCMHFFRACFGFCAHSPRLIQNLLLELMMSASTEAPEKTTCFLCGVLITRSFSFWRPSSLPCMHTTTPGTCIVNTNA